MRRRTCFRPSRLKGLPLCPHLLSLNASNILSKILAFSLSD
ncbi:hypothetical protein SAMN04488512_1481, partial [Sulfitobacter litoralis]